MTSDHSSPSSFLLYSPPVQRQKWGDPQAHPVTNYGDLFLDLFYVSAAYNLGNLIRIDPTPTGLLYFVAIFWSIFFMWWHRTAFDAKFYYKTPSSAHCYLVEVSLFVILAYTVSHIDTVSVLSTPENNIQMFAVCLGVTLGAVLSMWISINVMLHAEGEPAARASGLREAKINLINVIFYTAATVVAGIEYYHSNNRNTATGGIVDEEDNYYSSSNTTTTTNATTDDHHRVLAADSSTSTSYTSNDDNDDVTTHIPAYLLLAGTLSTYLCWFILLQTLPKEGRHKKITVPMNVDFTIHRFGEWVMLMLGESILSLLIVDVQGETSEYYITFYFGLLSVILLQYMHFRSQPHSASDHAMRRSKEGGFAFSMLIQVFSAALIILGAMYKGFLYEFYYEAKANNSSYKGRRVMEMENSILGRFLAAASSSASNDDVGERRQRIAHLFCGAMAIVWFCSDAMILTHKGIQKNVIRFRRCENAVLYAKKKVGFLCVLLRIGLLIFMTILSQYQTDPMWLSVIGCIGIIAQIGLRLAAITLFPDDRIFNIESNHSCETSFMKTHHLGGDAGDRNGKEPAEDDDDSIDISK